MNLHKIASGVISSVNPMQPITITPSAGYSTNASGQRVPAYGTPIAGASAQVQDLSGQDLRQLDRLNITGYSRSIYITGSVAAISRLHQKGGDLITLLDGTVYLTVHVIEQWPDWCKFAVTEQLDSAR